MLSTIELSHQLLRLQDSNLYQGLMRPPELPLLQTTFYLVPQAGFEPASLVLKTIAFAIKLLVRR